MADFVIRLVDDGSTPQNAPATSAPGSPGTPSGAGGGFGGSPADSNVGSFMSEAVKSVADRAGLGDAVNAFNQLQGIGDQLGGLLKAGGSPAGASSEVIMAELAGGTAAGGGSASAGGAASAGGGALAAAASNPYVVAAAATAAVAVGGVVLSKMYLDLMRGQAEQLEPVSAELSNQSAMADLRTEFANMRRADRIGGDLAGLQDFQSRAQDRLAEVGDEILSAMLDIWTRVEPMAEQALQSADVMIAQFQLVVAMTQAIDKATQLKWDEAKEANKRAEAALLRVNKELLDVARGESERKEFENDPWLDGLLAQANPNFNANPIPPRNMGGP